MFSEHNKLRYLNTKTLQNFTISFIFEFRSITIQRLLVREKQAPT